MQSIRRLPVVKIIIVSLLVGVVGIAFFLSNGAATNKTPSGTEPTPKLVDKKVPEVRLDGLSTSEPITEDISIVPTISSPSNVQRVELYVDDMFAAVSYDRPYALRLAISGYENGTHSIYAKIFWLDGSTSTTESVTVQFKVERKREQSETTSETSTKSASVAQNGKRISPNHTTTPVTPQPVITQPGDDEVIAPPVEPTDTTAPSVPTGMALSVTNNRTTVDWVASNDTNGVQAYRLFRNGTALVTLSDTSYVDRTTLPGHVYAYQVAAIDTANNISTLSPSASVSLPAQSFWDDSATPSGTSNDGTPLELGIRFRAHTPGKVTGIRFYKATGDTGVHQGTLWDQNGTQVAGVAFSSETASGWQQANFDNPVDVAPGEVYTVSYTSPTGSFSFDSGYFGNALTTEYLSGLAHGDGGGNGVYGTPGSRPTQSYNATNYWVSPIFTPNEDVGANFATTTIDTSMVYPGFPGSNNTGVPAGKNLEIYTGPTSLQSGTNITIDNKIIYGGLRLYGNAKATITNSLIYGRVDVDSTSAELSLTDTEVNAGGWSNAALGFRNVMALRVNVHGGSIGVACSGTCSVEDSWIHDQTLEPNSASRVLGFLSNGGSDISVIGNTIACDHPSNSNGGGCSGTSIITGDFAQNLNVLFEGNFFRSTEAAFCTTFGYEPAKPYGNNPTNIVVRNNIWERGLSGNCATNGPAASFLPANGNVWEGNTYDDGSVVNYQ